MVHFLKAARTPEWAIDTDAIGWIRAYFQRRPKSSSAGFLMKTPDYLVEKGGTVRFLREG
jgi:hypothetical protein